MGYTPKNMEPGTYYVGPWNPTNSKTGKEDYSSVPTSVIDWAAKEHDRDYDKFFAEGPFDAMFNTKVINADKLLQNRASVIKEMYKQKKIDKLTNKPISKHTAYICDKVIDLLGISIPYKEGLLQSEKGKARARRGQNH
jgi:hypothetical protein